MATEKKQIGVYLVDVSGSMGGDRLANCKKFVTSMRDTADRFTIYTYGDYPKEVTYDNFMKTSANGGTKIEVTMNQMFTTHLLKDKQNLVDFVLLTDAEDSINDVNKLKANVIAAKKQFSDCGSTLDTSAVFVLKDGKWNETAKRIKEAIGGADVFDNAALDSKLKETKQGLKECNDARKVYMQCKAEMDVIKRNLKSSISDDEKNESKEAKEEKEKKKVVFEKVEKVTKENDENVEKLETQVTDLLSADFLNDVDDDTLDEQITIYNVNGLETETKAETEAKTEAENKTDAKDAKEAKETKEELTPDDLDNLLDEIDSDIEKQNLKLRKAWIVGSKVEIYSRATQKWIPGQITQMFKDKDTQNEWVVAKYGDREREVVKNSADIRPISQLQVEKTEKKSSEKDKKTQQLEELYEKLDQVRVVLDATINDLKSLLGNETAKSTISKFEDLEALLNNITIQSVQSKVESMKDDLLSTKTEILGLLNELDAKASQETKVNEQITKMAKKRTYILKVQQRIQRVIEEQQLGFVCGDMRQSQQTIVRRVFLECMKSNKMSVSDIRDQLRNKYFMNVIVTLVDSDDANVPDYDGASYEYARYNCPSFGIYDVMNHREKVVLTEEESKAIYNVEEMEEKCNDNIRRVIKAVKDTKDNAFNSQNMISQQRKDMHDMVDKKMNELQKNVQESESLKLEIYNYNLKTMQQMESEVKDVQIEFDDVLRNQSLPGQIRKSKITSQSQSICDKGTVMFKDDVAKSVTDKIEMKFDSDSFNKIMQTIGIVDDDILAHELKVASTNGTEAQIAIEYKSQDKILSYALQYKQILMTDNEESVFNNYMQMMNEEIKSDNMDEEKEKKEEKEEKASETKTETKEAKEEKKETETETKEEKEEREKKEKKEQELEEKRKALEIKNSKPIYTEFEGEEKSGKVLTIKDLKRGGKYCIRSKIKILGCANWTKYSTIKLFVVSSLEIMGKNKSLVKFEKKKEKEGEYTLSHISSDKIVFGNIPLRENSKWKWEIVIDKHTNNADTYFGIDSEDNDTYSGRSATHSYGVNCDQSRKQFYANNKAIFKATPGIRPGHKFELFFDGPQKEFSMYGNDGKLIYTFKNIQTTKLMYASFFMRSYYAFTIRNFRNVM